MSRYPERIGGDRSEIDRMTKRLQEGKWVGSGGAGFTNDVAGMLFALAESEHKFACHLATALARAERAEALLARAYELGRDDAAKAVYEAGRMTHDHLAAIGSIVPPDDLAALKEVT